MSVSAKYDFRLEVSEDPDLALDLVADPSLTHRISGLSGTLNATSTVPATKAWSDSVGLVAGTATIDMTALARGLLSNATLTGLKVQLAIFRSRATNTAGIVITDGAVNGYLLFGDVSGQVTLLPGAIHYQYQPDVLADVDATHKTIDVTSGDVDAIFDAILVAG